MIAVRTEDGAWNYRMQSPQNDVITVDNWKLRAAVCGNLPISSKLLVNPC